MVTDLCSYPKVKAEFFVFFFFFLDASPFHRLDDALGKSHSDDEVRYMAWLGFSVSDVVLQI